MGQYAYEVFEVTDYGKEVGERIGAILIKSTFLGYYHRMYRYIKKTREIEKVGEMHYLFKIEADIEKQRKEAIEEMKDKLSKKRKFLTRNVYESRKKLN